MVINEDLTWGGEHITQYTDDVLWNCTPETNIILLTNVTPIYSRKKVENKNKIKFDKSVLLILPSCKNYTYPGHNFIYYKIYQKNK